jgi:SAM-dependent methyltransferase
MKPEPALSEIRRVLRPDGRLAVVWNDWNLDDAFTRDFVGVMRSYAGAQPHEDREKEAAPLFATRHFRDVERRDFVNTHIMDRDQLADRMFSISYIPRAEPAASQVMSAIDDLHARYARSDGTVTHHYVTCVYIARRTP